MAHIKITHEQAQQMLAARSRSTYDRKTVKKQIFAAVREQYGIPASTKFRVSIETPDNPLYCVLRNKHTDKPLDDGIAAPAALPAPTAVSVGTSPATKPAKKAPAKKPAAKKVTVTKKIVAKAVKKPAAPVKKSAVKKAAPAKKAAPKAAVKKSPAKKAAK